VLPFFRVRTNGMASTVPSHVLVFPSALFIAYVQKEAFFSGVPSLRISDRTTHHNIIPSNLLPITQVELF
jgi:hypothetical protein